MVVTFSLYVSVTLDTHWIQETVCSVNRVHLEPSAVASHTRNPQELLTHQRARSVRRSRHGKLVTFHPRVLE